MVEGSEMDSLQPLRTRRELKEFDISKALLIQIKLKFRFLKIVNCCCTVRQLKQ